MFWVGFFWLGKRICDVGEKARSGERVGRRATAHLLAVACAVRRLRAVG
ncbi:hypothetical protein ARMA_1934 [Ardenticatena maritima]|uniref:Uncharacterized protein n=1 Tax=Ardenticatena maritima TaxID=872965 RepID=A0A0M8K9C0_9CHLR|nr:hypothetical protein ARMA_1934 [Ardenticatena maritima]